MLLKLLDIKSKVKKHNIDKELNSFLDEKDYEKPKPHELKLADFDRIKKAVEKGINEDKFMKELDKLDGEDKDAFAVMIPQQYQILKDSIPQNISTDLFGIDEKEPSDFEKSKFIRSVRVLQDPGYVIDLMKSGTLTGTEVDALKLYYPVLYESLKEKILEKIAERFGKKDAKLDRRRNSILSMVLEVPRINPSTLEILQNNLLPKEEEGGQDVNVDTEMGMTDVQQTLNK